MKSVQKIQMKKLIKTAKEYKVLLLTIIVCILFTKGDGNNRFVKTAISVHMMAIAILYQDDKIECKKEEKRLWRIIYDYQDRKDEKYENLKEKTDFEIQLLKKEIEKMKK